MQAGIFDPNQIPRWMGLSFLVRARRADVSLQGPWQDEVLGGPEQQSVFMATVDFAF